MRRSPGRKGTYAWISRIVPKLRVRRVRTPISEDGGVDWKSSDNKGRVSWVLGRMGVDEAHG